MQFFTEIEIKPFDKKIGYQSKVMMMGSCFTENIGIRLEKFKFNIDLNPFGILYNPISVANSLKILKEKRYFKEDDFFFRDGLWHSFAHHGRFSAPDKTIVLDKINSVIETSSETLKTANFLFVTFGTSWVYELKSTRQVVANCHKVPSDEFHRFRLPETEITEVYVNLLKELWGINPGLQVFFTVSPIRHWKDGAVENQISKATLILAISNIVDQFPSQCHYFPSYEIVMDELRDYRFYADDMLHLSDVAINHIWQKFENSLIDEKSRSLMSEIGKIKRAMEHRPFNRNTPEFNKFIKKSLDNVNMLQAKHPYLNLKLEKAYFNEQLPDFEH